jgi:hypothetical protein
VNRAPEPPPDPIVGRLRREGSSFELEDVLALVGYVGPGKDDDHFRMFPDESRQLWLELPDSISVDSEPDELPGRAKVWVRREEMHAPMFKEDSVLDALADQFDGDAGMSTWNLIPDSIYMGAAMLELVADEEGAYS